MPDLASYAATLTYDEIGYVYLAGPYRGKDALAHDWTVFCEIDAHINEARRWSARLAHDSIPFVCPHMNSAHMEVIVPDVCPEFWLHMDLAILAHATAILLIPGWRDSQGARVEKEFAQKEGIAIYTHNTYNDLVADWWGRLDAEVAGKEEGYAIHQQ